MPVHYPGDNAFCRTYTGHSTRWYRSLIRLKVFLRLSIARGCISSLGHNRKTLPQDNLQCKCHNSCRLLTLHGTGHLSKEDHRFLPYSLFKPFVVRQPTDTKAFISLAHSIIKRSKVLRTFWGLLKLSEVCSCFDEFTIWCINQFVKIAILINIHNFRQFFYSIL